MIALSLTISRRVQATTHTWHYCYISPLSCCYIRCTSCGNKTVYHSSRREPSRRRCISAASSVDCLEHPGLPWPLWIASKWRRRHERDGDMYSFGCHCSVWWEWQQWRCSPRFCGKGPSRGATTFRIRPWAGQHRTRSRQTSGRSPAWKGRQREKSGIRDCCSWNTLSGIFGAVPTKVLLNFKNNVKFNPFERWILEIC